MSENSKSKSKTSSSDTNTDSKKSRGTNRSTHLPFSLDARLVKIVDDEGYSGVSEFIREAVRIHVRKWENHSLGKQVWNIIGGPLIQKMKLEMDKNYQEMKHTINKIHTDINDVQEDAKLSESDEADTWIKSPDVLGNDFEKRPKQVPDDHRTEEDVEPDTNDDDDLFD